MPKRILQGTVLSDKQDKTITVLVERKFRHPVLKKVIKRSKKYSAHDADNKCNIGDKVKIIDSNSVGTIDIIDKKKVTINYGIFTTKTTIDKLELVQKAK